MKAIKSNVVIVAAAVTAAAFVGMAGPTRADTAIFDFESPYPTTAIPGTGIRTGAYTSLSFTVNGLTIDLSRPGGKFDLVQNTYFDATRDQTKPAGWGQKSLDPFSQQTQPTPFVVNFSLPASSVVIKMGDYGDDLNDVLVLKAFSGLNASGTLLASATDTLPSGETGFDKRSLSLSAMGINSISFIGGTSLFPNSVFYDNLTITFTGGGGGTTSEEPPGNIPEPSALTLVAIGLAGLFTVTHLKRQSAV
jgi:hypothetical protein